MKKLYTTLVTILVFAPQLFSQHVDWLRSNRVAYSMNPSMALHTVCTSPSGNVFGSRLDSIVFYFGGIYGTQKIDCYNSIGQLQWSYGLGQKAIVQRIASDAAGNLYAAGIFLDNVTLNTTDSLVNTGPNLTTNTFLFSLDASGSLQWKRNLTLTYPNIDGVSAIQVDPQGRCWYGFSDFNNSYIVRVDGSGLDVQTHAILETRTLGSFSFDPQGNMYAAGSTGSGSTMQAGGLSVVVPDAYMMYVLRIDAAGQGSWIRLAHDVTFQSPIVVCDPWGGAYVGGGLMDSTTFGTVHFDGPQWVYDIFLTKVDSLGNFSWGAEVPTTTTITGDFMRGDNMFMDADASGNVYLTGITRGTVDWGSGIVSGGGQPVDDVVSVLSFDANGAPRWIVQGGSHQFNGAYALAVNQQGDCYFVAAVTDTAIFDGIMVNTTGGLGFVLGKISQPVTASVPSIKNHGELNIYPNPSAGKIIIEAADPTGFLELRDITGKLLTKKEITSTRVELDLSGFENGVYILSLLQNEKQLHRKVIKD